MTSSRTPLALSIPEDQEIDSLVSASGITVDKGQHDDTEDNVASNVICMCIILALIDILLIPIIAIVLAAETLGMFDGTNAYAECPSSEGLSGKCICDGLNGTCSLNKDDWYTAMRVFAVLFCIILKLFYWV